MSGEERRTKRRYAHELFPHPVEFEVRKLEEEVPYLYARAFGLLPEGTGWSRAEPQERDARADEWQRARHLAHLADALLQGRTGQSAWNWATERTEAQTDMYLLGRASHYGVDPDKIRPYPCGPAPDHHDHLEPHPLYENLQLVHRIPGTEDDCPDCTEPVPATENGDSDGKH